MNSLEAQHLKRYLLTARGYLHAVDDVSFTIKEDTALDVVGEPGCGRSMLGRLILCLLDSTEGEVYYKGDSILAYNEYKIRMMRQKMQVISQNPYESLNPRASVGEIISEVLIVNKPYRSKTEFDDKMYELMETVGLTECLINSYPHELDGGRRQRISIARALALNLEFIVCDKPVFALDVSIRAQILNLMQDPQERKGSTYMFITHNLSVVKCIFDNIMVMHLGQVVEFVPKKFLFSHPPHSYTRALLVVIPVPKPNSRNKQRETIHGEITPPINPGNECKSVKRCPFAKEICFQTKPGLAEIEPGCFVACHEYL